MNQLITFTEYVLPRGARKKVSFLRPPQIEAMAAQLVSAGHHFDMEKLRTGVVSITCENNEDMSSIQLVPDDTELPGLIDKLVKTAYKKWRSSNFYDFMEDQ